MALSAFDDPARPPAPAELARRLAGAAPLWKALVAHVAKAYPPVEEVWNFAGAKFGWSLRLVQKGRVLVYVTPQEGKLLVGLVLGEKAVAAARDAGLAPALLAAIEAAPRYAEGRGLRIPVAEGDDLAGIERLVSLKAAAPPRAASPRGGAGSRRGGRSPVRRPA